MNPTPDTTPDEDKWNLSPLEVKYEIQIDNLKRAIADKNTMLEFYKEWDKRRDEKLDRIEDLVRELSAQCKVTPADIVKVARFTIYLQERITDYKDKGQDTDFSRSSGTPIKSEFDWRELIAMPVSLLQMSKSWWARRFQNWRRTLRKTPSHC